MEYQRFLIEKILNLPIVKGVRTNLIIQKPQGRGAGVARSPDRAKPGQVRAQRASASTGSTSPGQLPSATRPPRLD